MIKYNKYKMKEFPLPKRRTMLRIKPIEISKCINQISIVILKKKYKEKLVWKG